MKTLLKEFLIAFILLIFVGILPFVVLGMVLGTALNKLDPNDTSKVMIGLKKMLGV